VVVVVVEITLITYPSCRRKGVRVKIIGKSSVQRGKRRRQFVEIFW